MGEKILFQYEFEGVGLITSFIIEHDHPFSIPTYGWRGEVRNSALRETPILGEFDMSILNSDFTGKAIVVSRGIYRTNYIGFGRLIISMKEGPDIVLLSGGYYESNPLER